MPICENVLIINGIILFIFADVTQYHEVTQVDQVLAILERLHRAMHRHI